MPLKDVVSRQDAQCDARENERLDVLVEADGLIGSGERVTVILHNISSSGMLIQSHQMLYLNQSIQIDMPEAGLVAATVIWQSKPLYGCRFVQPLPRAALSAIRLRNPLPIELDPAVEDDGNSQLPQRLRNLREQKGFSLAALSRRSGISKPSIWAWETGKTMPRPRSIRSLAAALGVSAAEIWGREMATSATMSGALDADASACTEMSKIHGRLADAVHSARQSIAEAAGVAVDRVKISIEL